MSKLVKAEIFIWFSFPAFFFFSRETNIEKNFGGGWDSVPGRTERESEDLTEAELGGAAFRFDVRGIFLFFFLLLLRIKEHKITTVGFDDQNSNPPQFCQTLIDRNNFSFSFSFFLIKRKRVSARERE